MYKRGGWWQWFDQNLWQMQVSISTSLKVFMGLVRSKMPSWSLLCYSKLCYSQLLHFRINDLKKRRKAHCTECCRTPDTALYVHYRKHPSFHWRRKSKLPVVSQLGNGQEVWFLSSCAQYWQYWATVVNFAKVKEDLLISSTLSQSVSKAPLSLSALLSVFHVITATASHQNTKLKQSLLSTKKDERLKVKNT